MDTSPFVCLTPVQHGKAEYLRVQSMYESSKGALDADIIDGSAHALEMVKTNVPDRLLKNSTKIVYSRGTESVIIPLPQKSGRLLMTVTNNVCVLRATDSFDVTVGNGIQRNIEHHHRQAYNRDVWILDSDNYVYEFHISRGINFTAFITGIVDERNIGKEVSDFLF